MAPIIEVIISYDDIIPHFEDLVPLLTDYFVWNINSRYQDNPDLFDRNAKRMNTSLEEILDEYHQMKVDGTMSSRQIDRLQDQFASGQWYFLLYHDDQLAGMMRLSRRSDTEAEVHSVYVAPQFRGQGYGSMLLQNLIEVARSKGFEVIYLDTMKFMETAIELYHSHGFVEVDYIDFPQYTPERAEEIGIIFMQLRL